MAYAVSEGSSAFTWDRDSHSRDSSKCDDHHSHNHQHQRRQHLWQRDLGRCSDCIVCADEAEDGGGEGDGRAQRLQLEVDVL
jgi:hypothetical protein